MLIARYEIGKKQEWDNFVRVAKNSTFLFHRDFMDYHSDRYNDFSLLVYNDKNQLLACFPANIDGNVVFSHQGLTYGSFCFKKDLKLPVQLLIIKSILEYLYFEGIHKLVYKAFPRFYNDIQSDEVDYALHLLNANLYRRDVALAVDFQNRINYSSNYRRESQKARNAGVKITESTDFSDFWKETLVPNLQSRFEVKPIHSDLEIQKLRNKFPDQIRLFIAIRDNKVIAGTVIFEMKNVAHAQYIAATDEARKNGALNLLYTYLLDNKFVDKKYFDFGIANDNEGRRLNLGLLAWKERMGGRTFSHDFYEIKTINYKNLDLNGLQ